jgi:hypothetical protein
MLSNKFMVVPKNSINTFKYVYDGTIFTTLILYVAGVTIG